MEIEDIGQDEIDADIRQYLLNLYPRYEDARPPGSINTQEAAELWGCDREVARRRLNKLVKAGKFERLLCRSKTGQPMHVWVKK